MKADDPDLPALEVAQSILSGGKTSRFYKDLVEGAEIATSADCGDNWGRYHKLVFDPSGAAAGPGPEEG